MNGNDFMKQLAQTKMPNLNTAAEQCLAEATRYGARGGRRFKRSLIIVLAVVAALSVTTVAYGNDILYALRSFAFGGSYVRRVDSPEAEAARERGGSVFQAVDIEFRNNSPVDNNTRFTETFGSVSEAVAAFPFIRLPQNAAELGLAIDATDAGFGTGSQAVIVSGANFYAQDEIPYIFHNVMLSFFLRNINGNWESVRFTQTYHGPETTFDIETTAENIHPVYIGDIPAAVFTEQFNKRLVWARDGFLFTLSATEAVDIWGNGNYVGIPNVVDVLIEIALAKMGY